MWHGVAQGNSPLTQMRQRHIERVYETKSPRCTTNNRTRQGVSQTNSARCRLSNFTVCEQRREGFILSSSRQENSPLTIKAYSPHRQTTDTTNNRTRRVWIKNSARCRLNKIHGMRTKAFGIYPEQQPHRQTDRQLYHLSKIRVNYLIAYIPLTVFFLIFAISLKEIYIFCIKGVLK